MNSLIVVLFLMETATVAAFMVLCYYLFEVYRRS